MIFGILDCNGFVFCLGMQVFDGEQECVDGYVCQVDEVLFQLFVVWVVWVGEDVYDV